MGVTMAPKVSVIIAVYNSERYLEQCLTSLVEQNFAHSDYEILCVDDGSTDQSGTIMQRFKRTYPDLFRLYRQEEKTDGAAAARNLGLSKAKGKYVFILDADDFFEKDLLSTAYHEAETTCSDILIYNGWSYDDKSGTEYKPDFILRRDFLPQQNVFAPAENAAQLFQMTLGAAWNLCMRRELIEREHLRFSSFHHADDLGFVYLGFAVARRIAICNKRLVHYRQNTGISQANHIDAWGDTCYRALASLKEDLVRRELYDRYKISFAYLSLIYLRFYLDGMQTAAHFIPLYRQFREKYLADFDTLALTREDVRDESLLVLRDTILAHSAEEYLFQGMRSQKNCMDQWRRRLPDGVKRIAVYGAGRYGTDVVCDILKRKDYRLVVWVDQRALADHLSLVRQPSEIRLHAKEIEAIYIAILSKTARCEVTSTLLELGIDKKKIVQW